MIRRATDADAATLARIWHDAWHDAHDGHVPPGLVAARTRATFDERVGALLPRAMVAEVDGRVAGFVTVDEDELELMFVDAGRRGTGVAAELVAAAEERGATWLSVVTGNARARRFYERQGYADTGADQETVTVAGTAYRIDGRRYVRSARTTGPAPRRSPGR
ncbi:GNAT family N-acetyltransferase [Nocardioides sp. HB32]